jgi:hypothetical protein
MDANYRACFRELLALLGVGGQRLELAGEPEPVGPLVARPRLYAPCSQALR